MFKVVLSEFQGDFHRWILLTEQSSQTAQVSWLRVIGLVKVKTFE
jgi:hypothetical protein